MPNIEISWVAVAVATVVCFFFTYCWYGVLFAKTIAKAMEKATGQSEPPCAADEVRALLMTFIGIVLMVFVLSNNLAVWQPTTWGLDAPNLPVIQQALSAAFFLSLGFIVPEMLSRVAWEKQPWKLFVINVGYYFLMLLLAAVILLML